MPAPVCCCRSASAACCAMPYCLRVSSAVSVTACRKASAPLRCNTSFGSLRYSASAGSCASPMIAAVPVTQNAPISSSAAPISAVALRPASSLSRHSTIAAAVGFFFSWSISLLNPVPFSATAAPPAWAMLIASSAPSVTNTISPLYSAEPLNKGSAPAIALGNLSYLPLPSGIFSSGNRLRRP